MFKYTEPAAKGNIQEELTQYLDRAVYYGFHLLVFSLPLTFLPIADDWFDLAKLMVLRIETIFILTCWIIKQLLANRVQFKRTKLDIPILIFLVFATISTFTSIHISTSILGKYGRYEGLLTLINYALLFFLATQTFSDTQRIWALQNTMVITTAIIAFYGLIQYLGYDFINWGEKPPWPVNRSSSTLGNPLFLAGYLALMLPIALSRYLQSSKLRELLLYGTAALLAFACLVTTFSRGGWIASVVALVVLLFMVGRRTLFSRQTGLFLLALVFALLLVFVNNYRMIVSSPKAGLSLLERVSSIPKIQEGTISTRLEIWKSVPRMVAQRPFLGWGPDAFHLAYPSLGSLKYAQLARRSKPDDAHNYFLQLVATLGIFGLLSFLVILAIFFWQGLRSPFDLRSSSHILYSGLLAGAAGYLGYLQSGRNVIDTSALFWVVLGLASVLSGGLATSQFSWRKKSFPYRFEAAFFAFALALVGIFYSLRPYLADVHFARAKEMAEQGLFESAVSRYESAMRLNPYLDLYPRYLGLLYTQIDWQEGTRQWFNKAVNTYLQAQKISPLEIDNYVLLGDLYLQGAQWFGPPYYALAKKELEHALEIYPYWADAHLKLGLYHLQTGNFGEALYEFRTVIRIDPKDAEAYFYLGRGFEGLKDKEKAIRAYKLVLRLNPDNWQAKQALERLEE